MKIQQTFTLTNTIPFSLIEKHKLHIKLKYFGVEIPAPKVESTRKLNKRQLAALEDEEFLYHGNMLFNWGEHTISYKGVDLDITQKQRTRFSFKSCYHDYFLENRRDRDEYEYLNLPKLLFVNTNPQQLWFARFYTGSKSKKFLYYFLLSLNKFIRITPTFLHLSYLLSERNSRIYRSKFKDAIQKKKLWFYGTSHIFWKKWLASRFYKARKRRFRFRNKKKNKRRWLVMKRRKLRGIYQDRLTPAIGFVKVDKALLKLKKKYTEEITNHLNKCIKSFSSKSGYDSKFTSILFLSFFLKKKLYRKGSVKILNRYILRRDKLIERRKLKKEQEKKSIRRRRLMKKTSRRFYQLATANKTSYFYLRPIRVINRSLKRNGAPFARFLFKLKRKLKKGEVDPKYIIMEDPPIITDEEVLSEIREKRLKSRILRSLRVKFGLARLDSHFPIFRMI